MGLEKQTVESCRKGKQVSRGRRIARAANVSLSSVLSAEQQQQQKQAKGERRSHPFLKRWHSDLLYLHHLLKSPSRTAFLYIYTAFKIFSSQMSLSWQVHPHPLCWVSTSDCHIQYRVLIVSNFQASIKKHEKLDSRLFISHHRCFFFDILLFCDFLDKIVGKNFRTFSNFQCYALLLWRTSGSGFKTILVSHIKELGITF